MDRQKDAVPPSFRRDLGSSVNSGGTNGHKEQSRHRQSVVPRNNADRSAFMAFYATRDSPPVCNRALASRSETKRHHVEPPARILVIVISKHSFYYETTSEFRRRIYVVRALLALTVYLLVKFCVFTCEAAKFPCCGYRMLSE